MDQNLNLPLFGTTQAPPRPGPRPMPEAPPPPLVATAPPPPAGVGTLVRVAWPVLSMMSRIVGGATASDTDTLLGAAVAQVRLFEQAALATGLSPRDVSAARYVLCSAADEVVLLSPWGRASDWNQGTLLSRFHGETWGGEKVFAIIERVLQTPEKHLDLIELLHVVMLLGFQGRYRVERDGTAKTDGVRERLFRALRSRLGEPPKLVSPRARPSAERRRLATPVPVWSVGALCLVLAFCVFGGLRYSLQSQAAGVAQRIDQLIQPAFPLSRRAAR